MSLPPELIERLNEDVKVGDIVNITGEFTLSLRYPLGIEFMLDPESDIRNKIKSELERSGYEVLDIGVTIPSFYYIDDYSIPSSVIFDVVIRKVGGGTPVWAIVLIIIGALVSLGYVVDRVAWIVYYKVYSEYEEPKPPPTPPSSIPTLPTTPEFSWLLPALALLFIAFMVMKNGSRGIRV